MKKTNIMIKSIAFLMIFTMSFQAWSQTSLKKTKRPQKAVSARKVVKEGPKVYTKSTNSNVRNQISTALGQFKSGQYSLAASSFLSLSRRNDLLSERPQIKYYLGLSLMEQGLNQVAAFQFVDVIKSGDSAWTKSSLEKLLIVTDRLGDETLLNYAIQRIDVNQVPVEHREMLFYRLAEIKHKAGLFKEAAQLYQRVGSQSRYYFSALYGKGLALAEAGHNEAALQAFQTLVRSREGAKVTDINRVAAQMGIARVYYQMNQWEKSVEAYSKIPRDHNMWHDAMFEKTWAMLRGARFRSTLSNFQTLHSTYYEDAYIPETLLLRAIVYLYICKYDEMEKVVGLYDSQYGPYYSKVDQFLNSRRNAETYFQEVNKAYAVKKDGESSKAFIVPSNVMKHIAEEGNVRRGFAYYNKLQEEKKIIDENPNLKNSSVGPYAVKILNNRMKSARASIGDMVKAHMQNIRIELRDLNEQASFIRYEMINGKKESLKKRMAQRTLENNLINSKEDRSFYVQDGYEYYPYQGEFWLDELGNYHYLGKQSCE